MKSETSIQTGLCWTFCFCDRYVSINNDLRARKTEHWQINTCGRLFKKIVDQRHVKISGDRKYLLKITSTSTFWILTIFIKVCSPWVSHWLTAEQKQKFFDTAILLRETSDIEGHAFLSQIIAADETQIRLWNSWNSTKINKKSPLISLPKTLWLVKANDHLAYDWQGIIMTDTESHWINSRVMNYCDFLQNLQKSVKSQPNLF